MRKIAFINILMALMIWPDVVVGNDGLFATSQSSGEGQMVTGPDRYNIQLTRPIDGMITIAVNNIGDRGSPLQNVDEMKVEAEFSTEEANYRIMIQNPMIHHPSGRHPTWFGVVYDQPIRGNTGSDKIGEVVPNIALWGWAEVYKDGELIHAKAPAHVKVSDKGQLKGIAMEIGLEGEPIVNTPDGYLHVFWETIDELDMPATKNRKWETAGLIGLIMLNVWFGWLAIREPHHR